MSFLKSFSHQISSLGQFWQEKSNRLIFRWTLVFISLQIIILIWKFNTLPSQIPLYYSLPWGESQLASASAIFLLPIFSVFLLLINHLFAVSFLKNIPLLSRLLISMSLIISLFFLVAIIKIIIIIT